MARDGARRRFEFFGKHTIPVDFTIGDPAPPAALPESTRTRQLAGRTRGPDQLERAAARATGRMLVTLRDIKPGAGEVLMHPLGDLTRAPASRCRST